MSRRPYLDVQSARTEARCTTVCFHRPSSAERQTQRGGPCRTYVQDVKIRLTVGRDEIFYYPDVSVACGPQDLEKVFLTDPKLIVEVLSPSTERVDRGEKSLNYREIPALEEYVLIAQHKPEVTLYRRSEDWRAQVLIQPDAAAELRSIALTLPLDRIYEGTR